MSRYSHTVELVTGDNLPILQFVVKDAETDTAVNLISAAAILRVRAVGSTTPTGAVNCTITDPGNGVITATFGADFFPVAGMYEAEVEITFPGGSIQTVYEFIRLKVRSQIA
jgi:hypothetical protein